MNRGYLEVHGEAVRRHVHNAGDRCKDAHSSNVVMFPGQGFGLALMRL